MSTAAEKKAQKEAEAEATARFKAASEAGENYETVPGLRVTTKTDGFRRGGREWHGTEEVLVSEFSETQLEQLGKEPKLIIQKIDIAV